MHKFHTNLKENDKTVLWQEKLSNEMSKINGALPNDSFIPSIDKLSYCYDIVSPPKLGMYRKKANISIIFQVFYFYLFNIRCRIN